MIYNIETRVDIEADSYEEAVREVLAEAIGGTYLTAVLDEDHNEVYLNNG